jgi:uncharacterized protein YdeI (BOF family)
MKKILVLCVLTVAVAAFMAWHAVAQPSRYGTFTGAPKAEVAKLVEQPQAFVGKTVEIEGTISEQCRTMGCFFFFKSGKDTLRVDLQDIAMQAPMREGRAARVEGQMAPFNGGYQFSASGVEFE